MVATAMASHSMITADKPNWLVNCKFAIPETAKGKVNAASPTENSRLRHITKPIILNPLNNKFRKLVMSNI